MGGPFTLQFANHFIIYQKRPFRGRFGTGRLHSELWAWGVKVKKSTFLGLYDPKTILSITYFFQFAINDGSYFRNKNQ